ncbi:hypothetical protein WA026_021446 [Henosepilachna vigintioctopunctata]|uniref:Uncharacterized protein n=1 Tax=Henosepilachna vigintioctopunctata TaxID=420089 RepID=A0AAW1TQX6_9CUCU
MNPLKHNFDKTSRMAGKDWFYGFENGHTEISFRKPDSTSNNRITVFNESEVKNGFNNLEGVQAKYHFDGNQIYNVDETVFLMSIESQESWRQKQVVMETSGDRGTATTVGPDAFSASGSATPLFFQIPHQIVDLHNVLIGIEATLQIAGLSDHREVMLFLWCFVLGNSERNVSTEVSIEFKIHQLSRIPRLGEKCHLEDLGLDLG